MVKENDDVKKGILYIVGTPIGNLEDITFRAIRILKEVDLIASEDTNRIKKLLNFYNIRKRVESYHAHSKESKIKFIIGELLRGKKVAYVSDSGMPGVSDPGSELVKSAIENGVIVNSIPGPSAITAAISISGENLSRFIFEGFLPRKKGKLKKLIEKLKIEDKPILFFESPHRIKQTAEIFYSILGNREIIVVREISKVFEEVIRTNLETFIANSRELKGEITIILLPRSCK